MRLIVTSAAATVLVPHDRQCVLSFALQRVYALLVPVRQAQFGRDRLPLFKTYTL